MRRLANGSVVVLLALAGVCACAPEEPTGIPGVTTSAPPAPTPPPPDRGVGDAYYRASTSTLASNSVFVLYADGTFDLLYPAVDFPGKYSRTDSTFAFRFDGAGQWLATGTITGDTLSVEFNDIMMWSDFEDGTYVRR